MTRIQVSTIAFAFSALFAGQVMAANEAPVTRDQVKAELAQAIRTGDIIVGEGGHKLNETFPQNYPAKKVVSKSRAQVKAELAEAIRTGDIIVGEGGHKLNEIFPQNYPATKDAGK